MVDPEQLDEYDEAAETEPYDSEQDPVADERHDDDVTLIWDALQSLKGPPTVHYHTLDGTETPMKDLIVDSKIQIEFDPNAAQMLCFFNKELKQFLDEGCSLAAEWQDSEQRWEFLVERDMHNLTKAEEREHWKEVKEAKRKELKAFVELKVFEPMARHLRKNLVDARWVLKWKSVDGKRTVKARLCIRGFLDRQGNDVDTWSSTASRLGQRFINSVCVQCQFDMCCIDISNAFLRGIDFEQLAKESGQPVREVTLDPPGDVWELLREYPQFKGCSGALHVLKLLKGAYGLKDAPRLWKQVPAVERGALARVSPPL